MTGFSFFVSVRATCCVLLVVVVVLLRGEVTRRAAIQFVPGWAGLGWLRSCRIVRVTDA